MKLLITGARTQNDYEKLKYGIAEIEKITGEKTTHIIHGGAIGNDRLAERYANENGLPQTILKPDYKKHYPKAAPLLRNEKMINLSDHILAIYGEDGKKGGTKYTAEKAMKTGKTVLEIYEIGAYDITYQNLLFFDF